MTTSISSSRNTPSLSMNSGKENQEEEVAKEELDALLKSMRADMKRICLECVQEIEAELHSLDRSTSYRLLKYVCPKIYATYRFFNAAYSGAHNAANRVSDATEHFFWVSFRGV